MRLPSVHHSQEIPARTGYEQTAPESGAWRGCWPVCGWHPGLALAELGALLPEASLRLETSDRWVRVSGAKEQRRQDALAVASGLQCFLVDGHVASTEESTPEGWLNEMQAYLHEHPVKGSVAVRAWKQGSKLPGWSLSNLSGRLGGLLHDMGCPIDLESPDHVLALISDGPNGIAGLRLDGWRRTSSLFQRGAASW